MLGTALLSVTTDPPDDEEVASLVARGRVGDALDAAARAHGPAVERVCMALTGRPDLAAEITQDTFVAAIDALRAWRRDGSLRAFLCGIARKLCARERTRNARQQVRLHLVHDAATPAGPDDALATARRAHAARSALDALAPDDREVLVLRYHADLSYGEIARLLQIDEPTARKRASRALLRMRQALPEEAP